MKFGFEIDFKNDVIHHGVTAILLSALLYTRVANPDLLVADQDTAGSTFV